MTGGVHVAAAMGAACKMIGNVGRRQTVSAEWVSVRVTEACFLLSGGEADWAMGPRFNDPTTSICMRVALDRAFFT